ncbi:hypothetical protein NRL37_17675 [Metapseudomonas otitidis]|uniref:hypothetical protein n=1 Tax=Metapseudomonas otitidis TaxID=319939 RepID=UPI00227CD27F|nr:hypothetical protein [Pseudomonas otitidis]WAF83927.1 hypothetical protein NRL37_17675 [Pseudomonas otitidis]
MRGVWGWSAAAALALLVAGLAWWGWAFRAPASSAPNLVVPPAFALAREFGFGAYRLAWSGRDLDLLDGAGRSLWRTKEGFLSAGRADPVVRCDEQSLEGFQSAGRRLQVFGHLRCTDGRISPYRLEMQDEGTRGVLLSVTLGDPALDQIVLRWQRETDERFQGVADAGNGSEASAGEGRGPIPEVKGRWTVGPSESLLLQSSSRAFYSGPGMTRVFDAESAEVVSLAVEAGSLELRVARPALSP